MIANYSLIFPVCRKKTGNEVVIMNSYDKFEKDFYDKIMAGVEEAYSSDLVIQLPDDEYIEREWRRWDPKVISVQHWQLYIYSLLLQIQADKEYHREYYGKWYPEIDTTVVRSRVHHLMRSTYELVLLWAKYERGLRFSQYVVFMEKISNNNYFKNKVNHLLQDLIEKGICRTV